jgi:uncharacterized protein YyaL (SSP411 family)
MAGNILALLPPIAAQAPRVAGWLLATAQAAAEGPVEAAVVGRPGAARDALHVALLRSPSPGLVIAVGSGGAGGGQGEDAGMAGTVPLLRGRTAGADGAPLVYLCRGMVCERPVASVQEVRDRLSSGRR